MAGARVAAGVVGAAVGEVFTTLHETAKHVGGQTIKFNKSILKSLEPKKNRKRNSKLVIQDVLFLASDFQSCCFSHVKRIGNLVAHCLVRNSKSGSELQVWYNTTP